MRPLRAAAIIVCLLGCALTAACTPGPLGLAGVVLRDGEPAVLIRTCPGIAVNDIWVHQPTGDLGWGATDTGGGDAVSEVRLLHAPPGWFETRVEKKLIDFITGTSYRLHLDTDHREKGSIDFIEFTLEDLSAETVLARRPYEAAQSFTPEEFELQATEEC